MKKTTSPSLMKEWLARLRARGYRLTQPMKVIVDILVNARNALTPIELFDMGRREHPGMGLVTVYRALEKLEELGLVQRVHQADGCHAYLRAANGHEHFLLCTRCARVEYFAGDDLTDLIEKVACQSGFSIQSHWLQLHGLCVDCKGEGANP